VLDPTGYTISPGYAPITTEVEWMQLFDEYFSYWVKGERLAIGQMSGSKSGIKLRRSLKLSKTHAPNW